jgi:hypothetical protein
MSGWSSSRPPPLSTTRTTTTTTTRLGLAGFGGSTNSDVEPQQIG